MLRKGRAGASFVAAALPPPSKYAEATTADSSAIESAGMATGETAGGRLRRDIGNLGSIVRNGPRCALPCLDADAGDGAVAELLDAAVARVSIRMEVIEGMVGCCASAAVERCVVALLELLPRELAALPRLWTLISDARRKTDTLRASSIDGALNDGMLYGKADMVFVYVVLLQTFVIAAWTKLWRTHVGA